MSPEITDYINSFDTPTCTRLQDFYSIAQQLFPDIRTTKSYGVLKLYSGEKGYIAYFGGYKEFISLYPVHNVFEQYGNELSPYIHGKATARFYNKDPLPVELISRVLRTLYEDYLARSGK